MFKITQAKGFNLTFFNGWNISVQFGPSNYCNNRFVSLEDFETPRSAFDQNIESENAEVAIWHGTSEMIDLGSDTVAPYIYTDKVGLLIGMLSSLPKGVSDSEVSEAAQKILFGD